MKDSTNDPRVQALTAALAEAKSDVSQLLQRNNILEADVEKRNAKIRELIQRLEESEQHQAELYAELHRSREERAALQEDLTQATVLVQTLQQHQQHAEREKQAEQGQQGLARSGRGVKDLTRRGESAAQEENHYVPANGREAPTFEHRENSHRQRDPQPQHDHREREPQPQQGHRQRDPQPQHDHREREPQPQHDHKQAPPYRMPGKQDNSEEEEENYPPERGGGLPRKRMNHEHSQSSGAPVILHRSAVVKSAKQAPPLAMGSLGAGRSNEQNHNPSAEEASLPGGMRRGEHAGPSERPSRPPISQSQSSHQGHSSEAASLPGGMRRNHNPSAEEASLPGGMRRGEHAGQSRPPMSQSQSSHQGHSSSGPHSGMGPRSQHGSVLPTQSDGYSGDDSGGEADVVNPRARPNRAADPDREVSGRDEQQRNRPRKVQQLTRNPEQRNGPSNGAAAGAAQGLLGMRQGMSGPMNKKPHKNSSVMTVAEASLPGGMRRGEHAPLHDAGQVGTPPGSSGSSKPGSRGGLLSRGLGAVRGRIGYNGMRAFVGTPGQGTRPGGSLNGTAKVGGGQGSVVPMPGGGLVGTNPTYPEDVDIFDM